LTTFDGRFADNERILPRMQALVLNAVGSSFELEDLDIAAPVGREVLVEVAASGLWLDQL
jgi:hypothetical protein